MREAMWRRWLWWVCLVAAARMATPAVVAGTVAEVVTKGEGQGVCEVLDLSEVSPGYVLPTNLTVRPSKDGWRLDITLGRGTEAAVCVLLEDKKPRLRVTVLAESCDGGDVRDYSFLNVHVPLGVWTSLRVDVAANTVIVSAQDRINVSVVTQGPPLPRDGPQMTLTGARNVEAAVGCRASCPGYRFTSTGIDKKVTVREWSEGSVQFYFRPGNAFVKLQYEVACITPVGPTLFPPVADITLDSNLPQYLWHPVHLHHGSGLATVSLDNMLLKNKTLPEGCTFNKHIIRVIRDGIFSFNCNPFDGEVECMKDEGSSVASVATTQARMPEVAVAVITIESIVVVLLFLAVLLLVNRMNQSQKLSNERVEKHDKYKLLQKKCQQLEKENQQLKENMQQYNQQHEQQQTQQMQRQQ